MEKTDFKKTDKAFYTGKGGVWQLIDVPDWPFLMIDGEGDPNTSSAYAEAVRALYMMSYGLKFRSKLVEQRDFTVGPLEGLWWADDMEAFIRREKDLWKWRMMIRQTDRVTADHVEEVREISRKKLAKLKGDRTDPQTLASVRFEHYHEGLSAQALHIGSYDDEGPLLSDLHHHYLLENGLVANGHHHEIYLGDPRKVMPSKLKTILRQPVRKAS